MNLILPVYSLWKHCAGFPRHVVPPRDRGCISFAEWKRTAIRSKDDGMDRQPPLSKEEREQMKNESGRKSEIFIFGRMGPSRVERCSGSVCFRRDAGWEARFSQIGPRIYLVHFGFPDFPFLHPIDLLSVHWSSEGDEGATVDVIRDIGKLWLLDWWLLWPLFTSLRVELYNSREN